MASMQDALAEAQTGMRVAQECQSRYANKGRKESVYEIGDFILLDAKNLRLQRDNARRLQHRFIEPFKILKEVLLLPMTRRLVKTQNS